MMIRAIKTDADYEAALARVEEIFDSEPGSLSLTSWRSGGLSLVHMKMKITLFRRRPHLKLLNLPWTSGV